MYLLRGDSWCGLMSLCSAAPVGDSKYLLIIWVVISNNGLTQGSVLVPLLFILFFLRDIPIVSSDEFKYADIDLAFSLTDPKSIQFLLVLCSQDWSLRNSCSNRKEWASWTFLIWNKTNRPLNRTRLEVWKQLNCWKRHAYFHFVTGNYVFVCFQIIVELDEESRDQWKTTREERAKHKKTVVKRPLPSFSYEAHGNFFPYTVPNVGDVLNEQRARMLEMVDQDWRYQNQVRINS